MFTGLRTVIYHVNDIDKAKKWYAEAIGIQPYFDQPFYVGFNINGFELGLDPDSEHVTRGNNVVGYWKVDDIKATHAHLLKIGGKKNGDIRDVGEGILVASVIDPFGNVFGIIQEP